MGVAESTRKSHTSLGQADGFFGSDDCLYVTSRAAAVGTHSERESPSTSLPGCDEDNASSSVEWFSLESLAFPFACSICDSDVADVAGLLTGWPFPPAEPEVDPLQKHLQVLQG